MSDRAKLPYRRANISTKFEWQNLGFHLTAGLTIDGRVAEIFLSCSGKARDSHLQIIAEDLAMCMSHLLQSGVRLADLRRSFGTGSSLAGSCAAALIEMEGR